MSQLKKQNNSCIYIIILVIVAFLGYNAWKYFQQADAVQHLIDGIFAIAACIVVAVCLLFLCFQLSNFMEKLKNFTGRGNSKCMISKS